MSRIHPLAVVHKDAELAEDVEVGPFTYIGPHVRIGEGTRIQSNVRIEGNVRIGKHNTIFHGAVIGTPPQDTHFQGEESQVIIGDHNLIREYVTIHRATGEGKATRIGDHNFLMAYVHIAHNCHIGSHVIISNASQLGGYVQVEDYAFLSGVVPVHQFTRIGAHAMVGGLSRVNQDVPPYMLAAGSPLRVYGVNVVGLRRRGFPADTIQLLKEAYKILYLQGGPLEACLQAILELGDAEELRHLVAFIRASERGIVRRPGKKDD